MEENKQKNVAVFAGGCFWCTEAVFQSLKGVISVMPGYTGGTKPHPTYGDVSSGTSGHAEAIRIEYDPGIISYEKLLTVFFATHDPTTLNRQGNDIGEQYRSAVFYSTEAEKKTAEDFIRALNESSKDGKPIVTEVAPLGEFYEAEDYHRDYYKNNPDSAYCELVINPKLEKVQKQFSELLKKDKENKESSENI